MSRSLRLVLFGDGQWAANSLREILSGPHELTGVVLRQEPGDDSLERAARDAAIPVMEPERVNHPEFVALLREQRPDLGLSIAYNQIFRRSVLDTPSHGFLNFHAGKLPFYRGRNPINWALINGEEEVGVSAHFIDEGIDTGPILLQRTIPVGWNDDYGDVLSAVIRLMPVLVHQSIELVAQGTCVSTPQPANGTYFAAREEGDEWIDWRDSSRDIHNLIRGISRPAPGARTLLGEDTVTVWRATWNPAWPRYRATPGQVVGMDGDAGVLVKTGDSTIMLNEIEIPADGRGARRPAWRVGTRFAPWSASERNVRLREPYESRV